MADMANIFSHGIELTSAEIRELLPLYGYSRTYNPQDALASPGAKAAIAAHGIRLVTEMRGNKKIFKGAGIDPTI